jgi:hypothetical protein
MNFVLKSRRKAEKAERRGTKKAHKRGGIQSVVGTQGKGETRGTSTKARKR